MTSIGADRLLAGRYEIGELIGRGGMAEVHAGWDARLGREVAIKILRTELARDASFVQRFRREAQAAASLDHPAIVAIFDSGEEMITESGGAQLAVPYMVMERVHGRTLREVLVAEGPLPPLDAARVMAATLDALDYSHRSGIVHRDIKPANVMLAADGTSVKVMDFGIARAIADAAATMTNTSVVIGTAQYLSPEQARGQEVDQRSDVYAAGCVLFELLTGRAPFVADSPIGIAYQHVEQSAPAPSRHAPATSEIPADLDAVVLHALAKKPSERYQGAAAMADDLRRVVAGTPIQLTSAERADGARSAEDARAIEAAVAATTGAARGSAGPASASSSDRSGQAGASGSSGDSAVPDVPAARDSDTGPLPAVTPGRERRPRWLLILLTLVLAGLIGAAFYVRSERTVAVPRVVGTTRAQATAALNQVNLLPAVVSVPDQAAVGTVVGQDPAEGTDRPVGSPVTLRISAGPRAVKIPDLSNYDQASARQRLSDLNVEAGDVKLVDSYQVVAGNVVATTPKAGTTVPEGTPVTLLVSNGRVKVPDIRGKSEDDARTALQAVGLTIQAKYVYSWRDPGTVTDQSNVDETVAVGSRISLTVVKSRPPQPATVTRTYIQTPRSTPNPTPGSSGGTPSTTSSTGSSPSAQPTDRPTSTPRPAPSPANG